MRPLLSGVSSRNWSRPASEMILATLLCRVWSSLAVGQTKDSVLTATAAPTSALLINMRLAKPLARAEEEALSPGDMFKECPICPEMIVVPAGEFIMGAPESESGSEDNERPQHNVTIKKSFAVGRFAVTFAEWDACVSEGGCRGYVPSDRGWGHGRQPVINLRWDDAKVYVKWLSNKTGKSYRLLSEAEREYVTRAGTTTPFWWGSSISTDQAKYDGTYPYPLIGHGLVGLYREKTVPVDSFAPNPWGLYQVHGNLYEWVEDCWHGNYLGAPADGSAWVTGDCNRNVLRGGAWNFASWQLRSAARGSVASAVGLGPVGLRVARAIDH